MEIFLEQVNSTINNRSTYGIYNLGSSSASRWIELVTPILYAINIKPDIRFIEMPSELRNKHQYNTLANISKLIYIGYEGKISPLKDAVTDYIKNYLMQGFKRLTESNTD